MTSPPVLGLGLFGLYARSRDLFRVLGVGGAVVLGVAYLAPAHIPVLLASDQVRLRTFNLMGIFPVFLAAVTIPVSLGEAETRYRSAIRRCRLLHIVVVVVLVAAVGLAVGVAVRARTAGADCWLNGLSMLGITLAMPARLAVPIWFPVAALAAATYLLGADPESGSARSWAWLLWDHGSAKTGVDVVLFLAGAVTWVTFLGSRDAIGDS